MRRGPGAAALVAVSLLGGCSTPSYDRTIEVKARYSRFDPEAIEVRAGQSVRFTVRNDDPIAHELIIGDQATHDRHEKGTETEHGGASGEVSLPAGRTGSTTFTFEEPGTLEFACHLPGHYAYGMKGTIRVS